jgi:hypothetical protein
MADIDYKPIPEDDIEKVLNLEQQGVATLYSIYLRLTNLRLSCR